MQDTTDPNRNLNANQFNFDWRAGWQVAVGREIGCGQRVEARLMSIDSWLARANATTNSTVLNPLRINNNNVPPTFVPNVQTINAVYGSDLISVEMNYEADLTCNLSWLAGFRYIELDEHLHADMNAAPQFPTYDIGTRNRMYGFQTGVESSLWRSDCWSVDGVLKAGVFHNSTGHRTALNTGVVQPASGSDDRLAFAGELGFNLTYQASDAIALRAGYDLLWLETVALASDQIPATNLFTQTGINADGGVFYHGAMFSLEAAY